VRFGVGPSGDAVVNDGQDVAGVNQFLGPRHALGLLGFVLVDLVGEGGRGCRSLTCFAPSAHTRAGFIGSTTDRTCIALAGCSSTLPGTSLHDRMSHRLLLCRVSR
jgi:hypothetical protein